MLFSRCVSPLRWRSIKHVRFTISVCAFDFHRSVFDFHRSVFDFHRSVFDFHRSDFDFHRSVFDVHRSVCCVLCCVHSVYICLALHMQVFIVCWLFVCVCHCTCAVLICWVCFVAYTQSMSCSCRFYWLQSLASFALWTSYVNMLRLTRVLWLRPWLGVQVSAREQGKGLGVRVEGLGQGKG